VPYYPKVPGKHNRELKMRKFAFAMSVLALAFTASAPARAGFVIVKFDPGYCQIWWDSGVKPLGTGWSYMGKPYSDWTAAWAALSAAWGSKACM
jgi:hypothetical protein